MSKILITICARGGSVGIPKKNIKDVSSLPLIAYSIKTAQAYSVKHHADIALSTENQEILNVAKKYGLHTQYHRPDLLAGSDIGKLEVLEDLLLYEERKSGHQYDYLIDLDVTSPLRSLLDIEKAFETLMNSDAYNIFSVSKASRNPYFNMVEKKKNQEYVEIVKTADEFLTRQSLSLIHI